MWCKCVKLPWWTSRIHCAICIDIRAELERNIAEREAIEIASIAKLRILDTARRTDYIPGLTRKPVVDTDEYGGPERRKRDGTIFDRRKIQNAQFSPERRDLPGIRDDAGSGGTRRSLRDNWGQ